VIALVETAEEAAEEAAATAAWEVAAAAAAGEMELSSPYSQVLPLHASRQLSDSWGRDLSLKKERLLQLRSLCNWRIYKFVPVLVLGSHPFHVLLMGVILSISVLLVRQK
jgi:hypothetical protein